MKAGPNSTPTPNPDSTPNPENSDQSEQHEKTLSNAEIARIKKAMGKEAMIATSLNKTDQHNVIAEAISAKHQELNKNKLYNVATRVPIVGRVIKAGILGNEARKAKNEIKKTKDLSSAFEVLGLDPAESNVLNSDISVAKERAWQTLEGAGYSSDNQIDIAVSRLDEDSKVEKMDDKTQAAVKQALNDYYTALKSGGNKEELGKDFDEQVQKALKGTGAMLDLQSQKEGIEKLVKYKSINEDTVKTYLDNHVSLYKATMKEGTYTERKTDSIINAVVKTGAVGGIIYALAGREGRQAVRDAVGPTVGAGLTAATVGGIFGAARGWDKAKVKLSESEIKNATTFVESDSAENNSKIETDTVEEEEEGAEQPSNKINKKNIFAWWGDKKRKLTGEEKYLNQIEELRDRKDASGLIENLDDLMQKLNTKNPDTRADLLDAYADVLARGRFSSEKKIDLIKYNTNERGELEQKLSEVEKKLYGDDPNVINNLLNDRESDLNKLLENKRSELDKSFNEAEKARNKFLARSAAVDAVVGAATGFAAGALFSKLAQSDLGQSIMGNISKEVSSIDEQLGVSEKISDIKYGVGNILSNFGIENDLNQLDGDMELVEDPDGGFTVKVGDRELIGRGDAKGIEFGKDGALTSESKEILESAGIHVEEHETSHVFENATQRVGIKEFFSSENKEANGLIEINDRSWVTDGGRDLVTIGNSTHMDGDGNIIMQVAATPGSNVNVDDMKVLMTAGNGNIDTGIAFDVGPDGTVEIPADSPVASLFSDGEYQGGYLEVINEGADGHIDVYHTLGDGTPDINTMAVPTQDVAYNTYDYTFNINGEDYNVEVPEDIAAAARMEALTGLESIKGTGEPIGYESTGETTHFVTSSGEAVEIQHYEHHGGYSDTFDSYFGEKDGVYSSGESVVRAMVGEEGVGLSSREVDQIFLEKVNSGEIEESAVVEEYLKVMGRSPEAITTTRAMMGDFEMDLNGDGVSELIDTQDEINIASDIISRDPEAYDNFVNDTYDMFYDKMEGGSVRFVDQLQEQYDYTTWGTLGEDNNILQQLGIVGARQTDGVGLQFLDKNGNSIYDEATVRKLWHLPDNYDLKDIVDRLNCIQKTGRVSLEKVNSETTTTGKIDPETTTTGKIDPETTTTGKIDPEGTKTDPEGTKTDPEGTKTEEEITGKTDDLVAGDETDLPVTPEQQDDYVQPTEGNQTDPNVAPSSQVEGAPNDDSAFNQSDSNSSSGSDTTSSYSGDTSKWQGGGSSSNNSSSSSGGGGGGSSSGSGSSSSGGGGGSSSDGGGSPSNADPGSAEGNAGDRSDQELADILTGEEQ